MTAWNILIVDDAAQDNDPSGRFLRYRKIEDELYEGRRFKIHIAKSQDHARTLIREHNFDFIILDVRLEQWNDDDSGTLFRELFILANERASIGLVSNRWDQTSTQLVREFLLQNSKLRLPLFFTFNDFECGAFAALVIQIVTYIRQQRQSYNLGIYPSDPIRILHLSDLHFGANIVGSSLAGIANLELLCDKIKAEWPSKNGVPPGPHLIIVTGDISNTGHPREFAAALSWFQSLADILGIKLPSPRILFVPGNHDFSIPLSAAKFISIKKNYDLALLPSTALEDGLERYCFAPYHEFVSKISSSACASDISSKSAWTEFGFLEYGIVVSGFNSSCHSNDRAWPDRAVDIEDIQRVRRAFNSQNSNGRPPDLFHIVASHHSLYKYEGVRQEVVNTEEFRELLFGHWYSPRLMLHGHEHKRWGALPSGNDFMVVAAPTPTVDAANRPNNTAIGVNLVNLDREGLVVKGVKVNSFINLEERWTLVKLANKSEFILPNKTGAFAPVSAGFPPARE